MGPIELFLICSTFKYLIDGKAFPIEIPPNSVILQFDMSRTCKRSLYFSDSIIFFVDLAPISQKFKSKYLKVLQIKNNYIGPIGSKVKQS